MRQWQRICLLRFIPLFSRQCAFTYNAGCDEVKSYTCTLDQASWSIGNTNIRFSSAKFLLFCCSHFMCLVCVSFDAHSAFSPRNGYHGGMKGCLSKILKIKYPTEVCQVGDVIVTKKEMKKLSWFQNTMFLTRTWLALALWLALISFCVV